MTADLTIDAVTAGLDKADYLADSGLATAVLLALELDRPLFLEGEPGVGKTEVARALARWSGGELIRLQCYEGIDVGQALYEWDHARQLLHLRAAEAVGDAVGASAEDLESVIYNERFLVKRPLLQAISAESGPAPVLLIDEVDRADDEFEAFLLEVLSEYEVTIPELGTINAEIKPIVVITSNRTRDVHDALKRRCIYHWVDHPSFEREVEILTRRTDNVPAAILEQVAVAANGLRAMSLYKPPGISESIDWANSLGRLGVAALDAESAKSTIGTVLKYREDQQRVSETSFDALLNPTNAQ